MSARRQRKALLISDIHVPYENKKATEAVLQLAKDERPTDIHFVGDTGDQYSVSRFDRDPRRRTFGEECQAVRDYLVRWSSVKGRKHFHDGNHEVRIAHYIKRNANEIQDVIDDGGALSIPSLYNLSKYGFQHHSYMQPAQLPGLPFLITHGESYGKYVGRNYLKKFGSSGASGHSHRQSMSVATLGGEEKWSLKGNLPIPPSTIDLTKFLVWFELGHMCDVSQADYLVGQPDWQMGGLVVEWKERSNLATFRPFRVTDQGDILI